MQIFDAKVTIDEDGGQLTITIAPGAKKTVLNSFANQANILVQKETNCIKQFAIQEYCQAIINKASQTNEMSFPTKLGKVTVQFKEQS
jgi:hypothetical protein